MENNDDFPNPIDYGPSKWEAEPMRDMKEHIYDELEESEFLPYDEFQESSDLDLCTGIYRCLQTVLGNILKCSLCPAYCFGVGPVLKVNQGWVAVGKTFGRYDRILPPGTYVINSCTEGFKYIDLKAQIEDVNQQTVLTRDNVTIQVDAVAFYQVKNPKKAAFRVDNYQEATLNIVKGTLKNVIGEHYLQPLLEERKSIDQELAKMVQKKTKAFGIKVFTVEIKEIYLPAEMQRAFATVAESMREKEAKIIDAEGHLMAAGLLKEAADEIGKNPSGLQLPYFDILLKISKENNRTVIIPESLGGMAAAGLK
jgi:regulator of protease activity HflC (stomatin/prohibitin superfamily)